MAGNVTADTPYDSMPDPSVNKYANSAVATNILAAPRPISAMAGATYPTISSGITKSSSAANSDVNVVNIRVIHSGKKKPQPMPEAMARMMLGSSDMRGLLMALMGGYGM